MAVFEVAVVGGGIAGVTATKSCLEEGLTPTCYEQHDDIGGIWYYTKHLRPNQGAASFASLTTNTSKETISFSDFPMPEDYPQYMKHDRFHTYIKAYVDHFHLRPHIRMNTTVVKVTRTADNKWEVHTRPTHGEEVHVRRFNAVIICSGAYRKPIYPHIQVEKNVSMDIMHMYDYRTSDIFAGKRVLVVGNASSAGDVACDASQVAAQVHLAVGEGTVLARRAAPGGLPGDLEFKRILTYLPKAWMLSLASAVLKKTAENYVSSAFYDISSPITPVLSKFGAIIINDQLGFALLTGKVKVKRHLQRLVADRAIFTDGSEIKVDIVVYATGYKTDFKYVECKALNVEDSIDLNLYKWVFPIEEYSVSHPCTLAVLNVAPPFGPHLQVIELQGRLAARVLGGKHHLPPAAVMQAYRDKERDYLIKNCKGKLKVISYYYQEELARELGSLPSFWRLLLRDPRLAFQVYFGTMLPAHYRLIQLYHMGKGLCLPDDMDDVAQRCKEAADRLPSIPQNKQRRLRKRSIITLGIIVGLIAYCYQIINKLFLK